MPIIPHQGSSDTQSSREKPDSLRPELQDTKPTLDGQAILNERVVEKTFLNNTAMMEDTFQQNKSYLSGLVEGRIIIVTYYAQNSPITDMQSSYAELTTKTMDDVHISWTEIRNFEIRLSSEMSYEFQDTEVTSKVTGEGLVLPGFNPRIGDIFLYTVRNDKIGIFTISNVARLALGQETYHKINFTMEEYLNEDKRDRFRRQSTVWYFDKSKFLIGNHALMNTEGWIQQKELKHIRREIINNYMDRFYNYEFSSFISPDSIYDPYVVEYWNKKVSIEFCRIRPIQLLVMVQNYHRTIWSVLTMNPIKNLKNVVKNYNTETMVSTFWGVNITSLLGKKFLSIEGEPSHDCGVAYLPDGTPVAIGTSLNQTFHGTQFDAAIKQNAEKGWDIARHAFYGEHLPHRKCAPHQHPLVQDYCDNPHECHVCEINTFEGEPPYPVVSTEELFEIWKKMHCPPDIYHPHRRQNEMAQFRGYVMWYREHHPGSLSRYELEEQWRKKWNLPPSGPLTEEQNKKLGQYIREYRSHYLPILSDRDIEWLWRQKQNITPDAVLDKEQIHEVKELVHAYRQAHGRVPEEDRRVLPETGTEYTPEETEHEKKVEHELTKHMGHHHHHSHECGTSANMPSEYIPHHPKPCHHEHCHTVCHDKCGNHVCDNSSGGADNDDRPTYALSPEFYLGSVAMDPFEYLLYQVLTKREFAVSEILDAVSSYLDWDDSVAFYRHLFSLYLIDKALYWLRFHS